MRLDLNLATQPYENVRDFLLRWGTGLALAVVFSVALVWLAVSGWRESRAIERDIGLKRQDIARLKQEEQKAQAILNQPQNSGTRARSALLNALIARKAFSWTEAFSDFEKLLPARVQVVSIQPQLDADNQLTITLVVSSDSREKAIELLKNLEDSNHFQHAQLLSEANDQQGKGGTRFQLSAVYVPQLPPPVTASSGGSQ